MYVGIGMSLVRGGTSSSPASLFAASEPGVWYDPSDITTLFTDNAGTTPVTAPNQTVGLMLDKSKNGIGANGSFCRNLLTYTEQFDNAAWVLNVSTLSVNSSTAPDGTLTADKLIPNNAASGGYVVQNSSIISGQNYTFSFYGKPDGFSEVRTPDNGTFMGSNVNFNLSTGVATLISGTATFGMTAAGNGWYRCFVSGTASATGSASKQIRSLSTGDGTSGILIWGAQLELGSTATAYQPITSSWSATIPGNHATQAADSQKPIYGINPIVGTRNLLTYTEQFGNAYWGKSSGPVTVAADVIAAPNGTITADKVQETTATADFFAISANPSPFLFSSPYTWSCYLKAAERSFVQVNFGGKIGSFDLTTGATQVNTGPITLSTVDAGNGWWRCIASISTPASGTSLLYHVIVTALSLSTPVTVGVAGSGFYIWGAQVEQSATATAYQKVVSQYEVTEAGVQSVGYLAFVQGIDDNMVTPTITPGTDKVQVFAGVRKLSDAAVGVVAEMSATIASNAGSFALTAPNSAAANYNFSSKGTTQTDNVVTTYTAPITSVIGGLGDIAGASNLIRVNGAQVGSVLTTQGTGNYLAYPLYLGRRGGTTLPFNGRLYSLIVRFGPNLTTGQITSTESWVNSRTGAY